MTNKADAIKELIDYLVLSHTSGYVYYLKHILNRFKIWPKRQC